MNIALVRLLGVDIWHTENPRGYHEQWRLANMSSPTTDLATYIPSGVPAGASMLREIQCQTPDFWKDKVSAAYLLGEPGQEYLIWEAVVELHPNSLLALVGAAQENSATYAEQRDALFDRLFPSWNGPRAQPADPWPRFASILYLELEESPLGSSGDLIQGLKPLALEMRRLLGHQNSLCLPHFLADTLLLCDLGAVLPAGGATAVGMEPLRRRSQKGEIILPETVRNLLRYMASIRLFQHLSTRLKTLPFYTLTLSHYIEQLKSKQGLSKGYELQFLNDRQKAAAERLSIHQLVQLFNRKLEYNYVSHAAKNGLERSIKIDIQPAHPYHYYYLDRLTQAFSDTVKEVQEASERIVRQESALADYLRDATTAEATRANLELQHTMRRLTLATIGIALIALIIGLFPEEAKQWLYKAVLAVFSSSPTPPSLDIY